MDNKYYIRSCSQKELHTILKWAELEDWNPGLYDYESFYAADNMGFLLGILNNQPIACISIVKYPDNFSFLGFYIVKPEFRGQGYGFQLWQHAIKQLSKYNIALDGVIEQQNNYKKSGFKFAYSNIRYQGISKTNTINTENSPQLLTDLLHYKPNIVNEIISYDKDFFPTDRRIFLKAWLNQTKSKVIIQLEKGKISGYGVIRPCISGYKIGPLFANSPNIGESIYVSLINQVENNKKCYLDIPETNADALTLAKKYNMIKVFETARMYTLNEPEISSSRTFGVTTFELG
ncbi:GNAT family N-acetyltransferase [Pseudoalteromonas denitrificans]|uniref:Acetyltransferase (GNAT) domain-containing protein n=1 Tax=Pseudoalteromonas denitrificans DSM 6059 TaxID=1123010 RepID=A0A1I1RNG3_9GAMM|nr:GNAT family N-acetyltransferase [Pseudoalteromonas denitrificans]SFD33123.1 Acetyltransferase (GNAT) domain-containing protein [Pseudoalteromonas denitrificans DSM 6059]